MTTSPAEITGLELHDACPKGYVDLGEREVLSATERAVQIGSGWRGYGLTEPVVWAPKSQLVLVSQGQYSPTIAVKAWLFHKAFHHSAWR